MNGNMNLEAEIIRYILSKLPDQHPFRLSRLLFLIDIEYYRRNGDKLTRFYYQLYPEAFYIEGFPEFLQTVEGVEKIVEYDDEGKPVRGYFRLTADLPINLPDDIRKRVDDVIERYGALSDAELNRAVISLPEYKQFFGP